MRKLTGKQTKYEFIFKTEPLEEKTEYKDFFLSILRFVKINVNNNTKMFRLKLENYFNNHVEAMGVF